MQLYPLKFKPILKEKIWGGRRLTDLGKQEEGLSNIGESWELSGYGSEVSIVENGYLAGNDLNDLVEVYMGELVGDKVYERYGNMFPLLIKLIDAGDNLSIQVHPDDETAMRQHDSLGKSEMWYALSAEENSHLVLGVRQDTDKEQLLHHLQDNTLTDLLNVVPVKQGDVAFVPAGLVHSLGKGVMVAEIQETSDLTYRLYDYDRRDDKGQPRELHVDAALNVMNTKANSRPLVDYTPRDNGAVNLVECEHFTTNLLTFNRTIERDYAPLDSFVIYMCIEGKLSLKADDTVLTLTKGETLLLPAAVADVLLQPQSATAKLLEIYIS